MSKLASTLKEEIVRIARKELRAENEALKKASARYRSEIAGLKRELSEIRRQVAQAVRSSGHVGGAARKLPAGDDGIKVRFGVRSLIAQRKRLGLSAELFGRLLGVSAQTIYNWETEKARPRAQQLSAFAAVRKMGKRDAMAMLGQAGEA